MGFGNITTDLRASTGFGSINTSDDINSLEGLTNLANKSGLIPEVKKITKDQSKLSILQRLAKGLGAFNPAEAILTTTEKGPIAGIEKYGTNIAQGIGSAIIGKDYEDNRRTFSDVAEKIGVENSILKHGIGILGDIFLDPTTYFGGAIARGLIKGTGVASNVGLKTLGKVLPETESAIRIAGGELKHAFGKLFQYGYKASKGAKEDVLTHLNRVADAQLGLAGSNMDRLGTNILSKEQQKEFSLLMVKRRIAEFEGMKLSEIQNKFKSADPLVQKKIEEQIARYKKISKDIGIKDSYENYYPFIRKDKLKKFFNEINRQGIRMGSESYRKEFKNLLSNEQIELDPVKAFFNVEDRIVTDKMNRIFLNNFVKRYGKPLEAFKNSDEALANGYKIIKEKEIFGKELGYVNKYDAELLRNSLNPEFQSINILAKATGFDALTSLFKRSVTGLFVPFHVRNFASGVVQNYETIGKTALNPKLMNSGMKFAYNLGKGIKELPNETINLGNRTLNLNKIYRAFKDRFGGSTFYTNDFLDAVKNGENLSSFTPLLSKETLKTTAKSFGLSPDSLFFKTGRVVGQFIEHQQKAVAYLGSLVQGKSVKEALQIAEKAGFDYRAVTRFESQIMRRLIPFYSFARKNIELQLKVLGENPQRINQIFAVIRNLGISPSEQEKQDLPDYITQALSVKIGMSKNGLQEYIANFGTPIEAFANLFDDNQILRTISMMNPLLKVPIEIGIGKDSFRQKDLKDVYNAQEYGSAPQIIKDLLMIHEVKKPILQKRNGKLIKTGERIEYVADPERLLIVRSLFTSRGFTYLDTMFNKNLNDFSKYMKLLTGARPYEIDTEVTKAIKERDMKRQLEDLLVKEGIIKKFERAYIPKK
jgi:hypothetical protein